MCYANAHATMYYHAHIHSTMLMKGMKRPTLKRRVRTTKRSSCDPNFMALLSTQLVGAKSLPWQVPLRLELCRCRVSSWCNRREVPPLSAS